MILCRGFYLGTEDQFNAWLVDVNRIIGLLGLHIDESSFKTSSNFINLLDIQYCFDEDGKLERDRFNIVLEFF